MLEQLAIIYYNIFGAYGGAFFGIIMAIAAFIESLILLVILSKVPLDIIKQFLLKQKPNEIVILVKPHNLIVKGKIIDNMVHFKIGDVDYAMFLGDKKYESFYGLKFMEIYITEMVGVDNSILVDLQNAIDTVPETTLYKYTNAIVQQNALKRRLSEDMQLSSQERQQLEKAINTLQEYIERVEAAYSISHSNIDKERIICTPIDWEKVKKCFKEASLSQLHNLAKSYGLTMSKMEKVNWEKIAVFVFITLIGLGALYMLINGSGGWHEANVASTTAKTMVLHNTTK